jgi:hypothetical protein
MFFFEKKNQKTSPGRFARSWAIEAILLAPQAFRDWDACGSLQRINFLVLFFKKELLPSFFHRRFKCLI